MRCGNTDAHPVSGDEYNKGYTDGYNRALDDLWDRVKTFYGHLKGNTVGGSVEYQLKEFVKEMRMQV